MNPHNNSSPVFVLCCSRSGSTLLRYILDSHPGFCCPPELHLVWLAGNLSRIYKITAEFGKTTAEDEKDESVIKKIRRDIEAIMQDYSEQREKPVWCEKSVFTIDGIDLINSVFPDARYLCLYRHCLDQVCSALDTLKHHPTGRGYGFDPFLGQELDSPINGLVGYWQAKTAAILAFEEKNPDQCIRLRYEDVVSDSGFQLEKLFGFLGADWEEAMLDSIFTAARKGGPGDHKISRTERIQTSSVGRGNGIDVQSITSDRIKTVNMLLTELGYDTINP